MSDRFQMSQLYVEDKEDMAFVNNNIGDTNKKINKIYDDFEAQLQAKDEELLKFQIQSVRLQCIEDMLQQECEMILNNSEHFYFLKRNEREFISQHLYKRFLKESK